MINQEREDLNNLIQSAGWIRLQNHINDRYGPEKMVQAYELAADIEDKDSRSSQIAQITQRIRAVRDILDWPARRIKQLEQPKDEPTYSRQGY